MAHHELTATVGENGLGIPQGLQSTTTQLANIRQVFNPTIADLTTTLGVSRQTIYKWLNGEATPGAERAERLLALNNAANAFKAAGLTWAPAALKLKLFGGRSLLDLIATGQALPTDVECLIVETKTMIAAYNRSGLAESKAQPTTDWQAELSIPGSPER
jgi:transcriptional regulator with XRE-family HTH domain